MDKRVILLATAALLMACQANRPAPPATTAPEAAVVAQPAVTVFPTATAVIIPTAVPTAAVLTAVPTAVPTSQPTATPQPTPTPKPPHPLDVATMRARDYPGSDFVIEQTLPPGGNYNRFVASYLSDGLKIFGLLTVPRGTKPATGWPVVIFNHGYIPPAQYRTTERYVAYQDAFARNGYLTFKSDYRGHGSSDGPASGGYGSPGYTIDVLNALGAIKRFADADKNRIGMWGHSMGGSVTLRAMVVNRANEIKAGVIWAGVVASYPDLLSRWRRQTSGGQPEPAPATRGGWRSSLVLEYGAPEENPDFWDSISPNSFLDEGVGPIQIHHGTADASVPVEFSDTLAEQLKAAGQTYEYFKYPGADHNISQALSTALQRSVVFFDKYVKNAK